jgi:N-acetylglucosaminyldiphosphoundecaprenol N-acetyl-beta-D-mannosaminyltransferase
MSSQPPFPPAVPAGAADPAGTDAAVTLEIPAVAVPCGWPGPPPPGRPRPGGIVRLAGLAFDRLTEEEVVAHIVAACQAGRGGWVVTPNIDICRQARRDQSLRRLVSRASLIVADGMPLIWAARLRREPLPERVTGASLIFSLTEAAARHGCPIYLLGGAPGVPGQAARGLQRRYPGLIVAGTDAPPVGFDADPVAVAVVQRRLAAAAPAIVYVGLGFPKQERLIERLAPSFPATWFVGCGAAIPFAAGALPRAPQWMQSTGLEWVFRLISEPRRLFRRYLVDDLPFAVRLLAAAAVARLRPARTTEPGTESAGSRQAPAGELLPEMAGKITSGTAAVTGQGDVPATVSHRHNDPRPAPGLPVTPGPSVTGAGAAPSWPGTPV